MKYFSIPMFYLLTGIIMVGIVHGSNSAHCPDSWKMSPYEMLTLIPLWLPLVVSSVTYTAITGHAQSPLRCEALK